MTETTVLENGPTAAEASEYELLVRVDEFLQSERESFSRPALLGRQGEKVALPASALRLFHEMIHLLAQGRVVTVVPAGKELTTRQAAAILNVSRPYFVRLLDAGDIPFGRTGTHRRIRFEDLMAYKRQRDTRRAEGLRKLTQASEELGLYDPLPAGTG